MSKGHAKEKALTKRVGRNSTGKSHESQTHPSHSKELIKLKRARGQIDGIMGMIEGNRYCPDILIQIRAAKSALQSVEHSILKTHLEHCVHDVLKSKDKAETHTKIQELIEMISRHI
jgi:DNA-binding FrmR family transcriptional regulator